ncbi:hypothetical protein [Rhizobium leguminosarum]|uniref:hypothetical protein n=1 Tax=Rhizobium leguminosarum TaxID=384 RepID=UPI003F996F29
MSLSHDSERLGHQKQFENQISALKEQCEEIEVDGTYNMLTSRVRKAHDSISLILDQVEAAGNASALLSPSLSSLRKDFILLNSRLHSVTEKLMARELLRSDGDVVDYLNKTYINKGFPDLLRYQSSEWRRLGVWLKPGDNLYIVGGGALPQTQIYLASEFDCNIISIDQDSQAVELCEKILQRHGNPKLMSVCQSGERFDYSDASIVAVATLVMSKETIGHRVFETSNNAFFAPRCPIGAHAFWRTELQTQYLSTIGWRLLGDLSPENSSVRSLLFGR